jgi:hypothetical protein
MKRACVLHDIANLIFLPILCSFAFAGLCGWADPWLFSLCISTYVLLDTVWIVLQPEAVPSAVAMIRVHHFVTLLLCLFPLLRPEVAIFACLDGLTEINTFFLIARRQWKSQRVVLTAMYWSTFIPIRLMLFPYLLVVFVSGLPPSIPTWERIVIWCCQLFLCIFNLGMVHRSLSGWWRQWRQRQQDATMVARSPAAALGWRGDGDSLATVTAHVVLTTHRGAGKAGQPKQAAA